MEGKFDGAEKQVGESERYSGVVSIRTLGI